MFNKEIFGDVYFHIIEDLSSNLLSRFTTKIPLKTLKNFIESTTLPMLRMCWERIFLLEMHLADADGLLQGDNENTRFKFFVREVIKSDNFFLLMEKYPGLYERWQYQSALCFRNIETIITRLIADQTDIAKYFFGDNSICEIKKIIAVGDAHHGMQQTVRVEYLNEFDTLRIVYYKPRCLNIDAGLVKFFLYWNQNCQIDHCVPIVLCCDRYGWTSSIVQQPCQNEEQVRAYYRRYGSLVALCHLFAATDLHKENLIASGEYPVIIDCETMFSCTLASHDNLPSDRHLYASCLLPNDSILNVLEISPLSAQSNVKTNLDIKLSPKQRLCNAEFETSKFITENCECEVMLGKQRVEDFTAYIEFLIDGMRETFEFILENRLCILEKVTEYMQEASVRILLRATASYVAVLKNSWHPNSFFQNEVELDLCKIADTNHDPEILKSELAQLRVGDIPYFSIQFNSTEIVDGQDQKLETPIAQTPQQKVEEHLSFLTPQFIDQSLEDLHYAILAYRLRQGSHYITKERKFCKFKDLPNKLWLEAIAEPVLDKILERTIVLQGNLYWRTIGEANQNKFHADLTGTNLYDGISGIALAFHMVSLKLNSERYKIFANKLVQQIIKQIEYDTPTRLGALTGTAGTLWAISLIKNNDQIKLLRVMERELAKLSYCVITQPWKKYAELDYLSGASGSLSMLLKLHELYKNFPLASDIAYLCSFIFTKIKQKALVLRNEESLLGLAHGSAGVSAALAEYMIHFSIDDLEAIAIIQSNVQRETSFRSAQGWPYLDGTRPYNSSWCHGTVGFGFSRLRCRSFISSDIFDEDLKIVIQRLGEPQDSVGLCHGMMADYHLAKALGEDEDCILSKIRHQITCNGITTDFGLTNFEIVGAMTGMTSLFVGEMLL